MKKHLHTGWRGWVCLLLSLALLALSATALMGCEPTGTPPVVDNRLNFLTDSGVSVYRIIYPMDDCPKVVREAAENLHAAMEHMLGVKVALTDDRGSDHAPDQLHPYEILIGQTARAATGEVLPALEEDEYQIRVIGHKIVIAGENGRATVEAVNYFITNVIGYTPGIEAPEEPTIKISPDYLHSGKYALPMVESERVETTLPYGPYQATVLYTIAPPEAAADALTLATLQGLSVLHGSAQIFLQGEGSEEQLAQMQKQGELILIDCDDSNQPWTTGRLINQYAKELSGYLLCSSDLESESVGVAISLAHHLNAVVVTAENEQVAQAAGLSRLLDLTDKNDDWLRNSPYFALMNKSIAIELTADRIPMLVDYAVMTGAYYYDYRGMDHYIHLQKFKFLEKGAHLLTDDLDDGASSPVSFADIGVTPHKLPDDARVNISVVSSKLPASWQAHLFEAK